MELGLQRAALYSDDVSGWLPVSQLDAATARTEVHSIRAAMPRTRAGAVTSQGDYARAAILCVSKFAHRGAGVTVLGFVREHYCYSQFAANHVPASGNMGYAFNGFLADAAMDASMVYSPSNAKCAQGFDLHAERPLFWLPPSASSEPRTVKAARCCRSCTMSRPAPALPFAREFGRGRFRIGNTAVGRRRCRNHRR